VQFFAEGGAVGDDYNTPLSEGDEAKFQEWKAKNAPNDSGADYDLRGAYKDDMQKSANGHMGDKFKKPNHPTFSDQSKYAVGAQADRAGHWVGPEGPNQTFVPPALK
jgi:allophanate hydrolase subunit 2